MRTKLYIPFVILTVLWINFSGCDRKIDLGNFKTDQWKRDFNGCDGTRDIQFTKLDSIKTEFVGMSEAQLVEILGKPNKQDLQERSRKSYLYYIIPGKQCVMRNNETKLLVVDFDALNRVKTLSVKVE